MSALEVRIYRHALRGTFRRDLLVRRRILVVDLGEEALEGEVVCLLAAGVLLAEVAAHAADAADLADVRALVGVRAEDVDRRGRGDELDDVLRARRHALAAADAEALVDLGASDDDRLKIADANASRMRRFGEIAKSNGTTIEQVQRRHAEKMRERFAAGSGVWYQAEDGSWRQK